MIVLGKQVGEVWKIPRIPPRASPSEEYSEFPDFSSLFTQDYYKPYNMICDTCPETFQTEDSLTIHHLTECKN